jgi:glutamate-1-semialdehyde 2,1-aminomutase
MDRYPRSRAIAEQLQRLVPGGSHTYAKGFDQYPERSPGVIARGLGCHVWDADGNEFIEYGMGLRAVTLGHAYGPVVESVRDSLRIGTNFTRPAVIELEAAEAFLGLIGNAEMVKFTKDGSTANTAALKLARKYTGRDKVAIPSDQPFLSYDDWFIGTTDMDGGIPQFEKQHTLRFTYGDLASARKLFDENAGQIAMVILESARLEDPPPEFLPGLQALCREKGALFVIDEMITGFRWHKNGAQKLYGIDPDLSTFGKAIANGFGLSALCGKRELMRLGSRERPQDDVFLLSTTHGAETPSLAAAIATLKVYETEDVIGHLHRAGDRLTKGVRESAKRHGVEKQFEVVGRACNLSFAVRDREGRASQAYRTLFLQELIARGVIAPSFVVSYSHSDEEIDKTIEAVDGALAVHARALASSAEELLTGRPSRPVMNRR